MSRCRGWQTTSPSGLSQSLFLSDSAGGPPGAFLFVRLDGNGGQRQFVDVYERFPQECRYLLERLAVVYHNDALARKRQLSAEARLQWHQQESQPTMEQLHDWLKRQFDEKWVEPNSALGGAIGYMLKHWERLTLFLRQAGAHSTTTCASAP
jgi:hypothetical protein